MNLRCKNRIEASEAHVFATSKEFCKLFLEDMRDLYLLSFVLTADQEKTEQCFTAGLEDCVKDNAVFKEWIRSWTRRTVLKNAIRIVSPGPKRADGSSAESRPAADGKLQQIQDQDPAIARLLALEDFDRFVFVMSLLERYGEKECSLLLGCSQEEVREARIRASRQIGKQMGRDADGHEPIQFSSRLSEMAVHHEK